jgi:predicted transcriptional regulator
MARELYVEENVIRSFIEFLKDVRWVKEKDRDSYSITERGNLWLNNMKAVQS